MIRRQSGGFVSRCRMRRPGTGEEIQIGNDRNDGATSTMESDAAHRMSLGSSDAVDAAALTVIVSVYQL